MKNKLSYLLVCVVLFSVTGCLKLWQDNLDIKTYMLDSRREVPPQEKVLASKLWIDSVNVLPPYNVRSLILRQSDVEFSPSYYSELLLSPSENFRNAFYTWFSECGLFERVSIVDRQGKSQSMIVSVLEFYADVREMKATLKIQVILLDETSRGNRVMMSKIYNQSEPVEEQGAEELVRAYNAALGKILTACENDLVDLLSE